jgi:hypothetical protein
MNNDNVMLDLMVKKYGYLAKNITVSDVVITSTKQYHELYKSSNGSLSDFENGWCLFYDQRFTNDKSKLKGTLHKVNKGVPFITEVMQQASEKSGHKKIN